MYTEASFRGLPPTTLPEIQRARLATSVLQLKAMGIDNVTTFPFMDRPPAAALLRALEQLYALGALSKAGQLTSPIGRQASALLISALMTSPLYGWPCGCC